MRAAVVSDGGQFNRLVTGAAFDRSGDFQRPTDSPTGLVSYAGHYAGVSNAPSNPTLYPHPIVTPPPEEEEVPGVLLPYQGSRVEGRIFLNADYNHNRIEGAVYDRYQTQTFRLGDDTLLTSTLRLENVVLVRTDIAENGTFEGVMERDLSEPWVTDNRVVGAYGGVIGGIQAQNIAGIIAFDTGELYWGQDVQLVVGPTPSPSDPIITAGTRISTSAEERGIFVIGRCDGTSPSPVCGVVNP